MIPPFLSVRRERVREREKQLLTAFFLTSRHLILHEYICSVYICVCACMFAREPICHTVADTEGRRLFFLASFPLDLFSNVDVYHLSMPAIHHPLFLSIIRKGVNLLKCESLSIIWFYSPARSLCVSAFLFVSFCPVETQVRSRDWL